MRHYIFLVATSVIVLATAYLVGARRTSPNGAELERVQRVETTPRPAPTIVALRTDFSEMAAEERVLAKHPNPPDPKPLPAAEASDDDRRAFLELSFSRQSSDVNWSRDATNQVREIFDSVASRDTAVRSVDCRSSLCRVELEQANEAEVRRVVNHILYLDPNRGWKGAMAGGKKRTAPDGTVTFVLFLAREGTDMPTLE